MPEFCESEIFQCVMCGECCRGRGGIVVGPDDLVRLALFLQIEPETLILRYGEISGGKLKIRTGDDGFCVFFKKELGCSVHEGKPNICRAWPFFRGNIEDRTSLAMAREFCPGIAANVTHAVFSRFGRDYLRAHGLLARDASREANALILNQENL